MSATSWVAYRSPESSSPPTAARRLSWPINRLLRLQRHVVSVGLLSGLVSAVLAVPATAQPHAADPEVIPGAYIVTLRDVGPPAEVASEHARRHGVQVEHLYRHAVHGYAARMTEQGAARWPPTRG